MEMAVSAEMTTSGTGTSARAANGTAQQFGT